MSVEKIEAEALGLSLKARARLAEKLLRSLEALSEEEIDQLWVEEAERRDKAADAGSDQEYSAEDVLREARMHVAVK